MVHPHTIVVVEEHARARVYAYAHARARAPTGESGCAARISDCRDTLHAPGFCVHCLDYMRRRKGLERDPKVESIEEEMACAIIAQVDPYSK